MKMHELKCIQPYFDDVWNGKKPFEIRFNDRDYQMSDILWLREFESSWDKDNDCLISGGGYSGRSVLCEIAYILPPFDGLAPGYVAMTVKILKLAMEHLL